MGKTNSGHRSSASSRTVERRSVLKTIGAVGVGIVGVGAVSGNSTAKVLESGGGGGDGMKEREIVHLNGEAFAEVHSNVVAPTVIQADFGTANMGATLGISFNHDAFPYHVQSVRNLQINIDKINTPGGYDFSSINGYKQDDSSPAEEVMNFALETLWDGTVGLILPAPSPMGLIGGESTADIDTGRAGKYIHASLLPNRLAGLRWNLDLHAGPSGEAVPGWYEFEVTCTADIGYMNIGWYDNNGFQLVDRVEQKHRVGLTVIKDQ